jgi:hypothetical protein
MAKIISALLYGEQSIQNRTVENWQVINTDSGNCSQPYGRKIISGFVLYSLLMVSCHEHSLLAPRYVHYVTDSCNGLRKIREHAKIILTAQYEPLDFVCLKEVPAITDPGNLEKLRWEFEDLIHFTFSIKSVGVNKDPLHLAVYPVKHDDILSYLDFKINKDFFITAASDTLPCLIHLYERSSTIRPEIIINLGFSQPRMAPGKTHTDLILHYNDDLFGTGPNEFVFKYSDLNRLPSLKIPRL